MQMADAQTHTMINYAITLISTCEQGDVIGLGVHVCIDNVCILI